LRLFLFGDLDIFDIASAEDDEAIFLLGGRDEFLHCPIFGSKGKDVFQRDRGLFGVDFMQSADIADFTFGYEVEPLADQMIHVHDGPPKAQSKKEKLLLHRERQRIQRVDESKGGRMLVWWWLLLS
jgi:hypothetical protein